MNETFALLKNHRSIRQFTDQPIEVALVQDIVRCGQHAASSSNVQACTVLQITDADLRSQIAHWAGDQDYVRSAGAFLVFCADLHRSSGICHRAGTEFVAGMTEHFIIATVDVALFAQNCVIAAESLGLGTCYIGAVRNHPQEISTLLELPDQVYPVFGLCLGYPKQHPNLKPRLPLSVVLKENRYNETADPGDIAHYDARMNEYYLHRSFTRKDSHWTQEVAGLLGREARPHMRAFLQQRGMNSR
ncbi:oxygen-insensitive NADPH nitroreductase [Acidithiobacillus ferridurans]|jgi:nitroreductase|uniref:Oxygen-insensitive NADPH nitroreductase n=2 Tax=Acidithiobacillus ferridurans TaxID=1232575 RepID=A0A8X8GBW7_ACIFI|nr:oxygen-insensitive NADPH nitroreductase [Acidithiobacillus ferridurans]MBU2714768.1 oxygen-insensitive NADPH nitroreductase [Acidithiobacillus ferridurans]MBU2723469.1 oxygen-insensitive NADPH nitroreductase [Acidithiobacillus ferridurans]MBU2725256.1 oxygen-insensitive NADPH nitroreductase [Acidithiobacillus ferridurans]BBF66522.1 NADPH-flavin oxidoreductase [Acidithiobacillus ferridurans]